MSEKTEEPTQKRLRDARRRGEVARSRELATAAILLAVGGALVASAESMLSSLRSALTSSLQLIETGSFGVEALDAGLAYGTDALLPVLLVALLAAALSGYLQVGPLLSMEPLAPKLERIDPIKGTKNLFSQRQLIELLKTLLKMLIIGYVLWQVLSASVRGIVGLAGRDAMATLEGMGSMASQVLFRVAGAISAIAVIDVIYQRYRHRKDQRMTKDEVKREHKDAEGDPHSKQQRQRMHKEIIDHNTVESVRTADVLVVNPTHLAVALRYDEDEGEAPEVVAKGSEHLAKRMIEAAHQSGVPIMRDVPLARALFQLEIGDEIPEALYEAVAVVLRAAWDERDAEGQGGA